MHNCAYCLPSESLPRQHDWFSFVTHHCSKIMWLKLEIDKNIYSKLYCKAQCWTVVECHRFSRAFSIQISDFRFPLRFALVGVCTDTNVIYQSVLEIKTYESQIWSLCIAKRHNVVISCRHDIVTSDTSDLYDYLFNYLWGCLLYPLMEMYSLQQIAAL